MTKIAKETLVGRNRRFLWLVAAATAGAISLIPAFGSSVAAHQIGVLGWDIHGTVSAADGTPIVGATVYDGDQATTTDTNGSYRLHETLPGTYRVTVSKTCYATQVRNVSTIVPQDQEANFALTGTC